jgi:hypothetical protein
MQTMLDKVNADLELASVPLRTDRSTRLGTAPLVGGTAEDALLGAAGVAAVTVMTVGVTG